MRPDGRMPLGPFRIHEDVGKVNKRNKSGFRVDDPRRQRPHVGVDVPLQIALRGVTVLA